MMREEGPIRVKQEFVEAFMHKAWWAIALRGLLGIAVGLLALTRPALTMAAFLAAAGAYFLVDGVFSVVAGFRAARAGERYWPFLLEGALSILVGMLAYRRPLQFALGVLIMVAVRFIVTGGAEIAAGNTVRRETGIKEWSLWIAGGASVLFGILLLAAPGIGIATLVWMAGIYALIFGAALTGSALRLKSFEHHHHHHLAT
ncbi:MAG: HdeD family acid-resistance protein [Myxococcales bacterium]